MTGLVIANLTWLIVSFHATNTGRTGRGKRHFGKRVFRSRRNVTLSLFITHDDGGMRERRKTKFWFALTITFNERKGSLWSLSVNV